MTSCNKLYNSFVFIISKCLHSSIYYSQRQCIISRNYENIYGDKPLSVLTATACTALESDSGVRRARYTIPNSPVGYIHNFTN